MMTTQTSEMLPFLVVILLALWTFDAALETIAGALTLKSLKTPVPKEISDEFKEIYDADRYAKSQAYTGAKTRLALFSQIFSWATTVAFIVLGGPKFAHELSQGSPYVFLGGILLAKMFLDLPFSIYSTFVIEEKFGFNRTTPAQFIKDALKGVAIGAVLGGFVLKLLLWVLEGRSPEFYQYAWLVAWAAFSAFQLFLTYVAPFTLMPLFNKFSALPEGDLKKSVEAYLSKLDFKLSRIEQMDGSKRSNHGNAFFTGFGRFRRLVLFDTLIEKHPVSELIGVLAHEVGHFKKGHVPKMTALSFLISLGAFYALHAVIHWSALFESFGIPYTSPETLSTGFAWGFAFWMTSLVLGPLGRVVSILTHWLSRVHEYEADKFSSDTTGDPNSLIAALKRLSGENLGHLTPHPFKVVLDYTHPPVFERIKRLKKLSA